MSWKCCMLKKCWFCLDPQPCPCIMQPCVEATRKPNPCVRVCRLWNVWTWTCYTFFVKWVDISNKQTLCTHHFTTCFTCAFLGSCCSLVVLMEPQEMAYKVPLAWQLNQGMAEVVHDPWAFNWVQIEWSCKPYVYCTVYTVWSHNSYGVFYIPLAICTTLYNTRMIAIVFKSNTPLIWPLHYYKVSKAKPNKGNNTQLGINTTS